MLPQEIINYWVVYWGPVFEDLFCILLSIESLLSNKQTFPWSRGVYVAPVKPSPYWVCFVLSESIDRPAWLAICMWNQFKSSQLHSLVLTRISFNDFPLQCDNRDGFEYYTTMQLHHNIRSRFFLLFLSSREWLLANLATAITWGSLI